MITRVVRVDVQPDQIDAVVAAYREVVRPIHVGRPAFVSITCWLIGRRAAFGSEPQLEVYDVADQLPSEPRR